MADGHLPRVQLAPPWAIATDGHIVRSSQWLTELTVRLSRWSTLRDGMCTSLWSSKTASLLLTLGTSIFMLLMPKDQNTARLISVFVPNSFQTVRSDVRLRLDNEDGRDNLGESIISTQNINTAGINFILSASSPFGNEITISWMGHTLMN